MYKYRDIRTVHLEITSRCNASCPQCPRNINGGPVSANLLIAELSAERCRKIFVPDFLKQLKYLYLCGNYGDAVAAADTLEIIQYFRAQNPYMKLRMYTNGGAREELWWQQIATTGTTVRFGIDGLEDTNHLYRRGVKWQKLIQNVSAFVSAGGKAEWAFIVFRHNEHQVEKAQQLALELGFKRFLVRRTKRFCDEELGSSSVKQPVINVNGKLEYYIEVPEETKYVVGFNGLQAHLSYDEYLQTTDIECSAQNEGMVYISAEGYVFPCCWIGHIYPSRKTAKHTQIEALISSLPNKLQSLDGELHGIESVINGDFFQRFVPDGWQKTGRLRVCAENCGKQNLFNAQLLTAESSN